MNAPDRRIVALPNDTVVGALYDVATALPVSPEAVQRLQPSTTITDCVHVATVLEQVQRLLRKRSARS